MSDLRPLPPREAGRILLGLREFAIERLRVTFSALLDRVGEILSERAGGSAGHDEAMLNLDARRALIRGRKPFEAELERRLRAAINEHISGDTGARADFSKVDATQLTLIDASAMDVSVLAGNIRQSIENACHDELVKLNFAMGRLLERPDLGVEDDPVAPAVIVEAFAESLQALDADAPVKLAILRTVKQASFEGLKAFYVDMNRRMVETNVVPENFRPPTSRATEDRPRPAKRPGPQSAAKPEADLMELFRQMQGRREPGAAGVAATAEGLPPQLFGMSGALGGEGDAYAPLRGALPQTGAGYAPGRPVIATAELDAAIARMQADVKALEAGAAANGQWLTAAQQENVLRALQHSDLGRRANQLEAMTIELVAMLFDYVFETTDLPDGIKALLARLQIPVLKAAMLDGAFFGRKDHPARVLVNTLAQAGLGWTPAMGYDDPLYRKIHDVVHRVLDDFEDDLSVFEQQCAALGEFVAAEEQVAEEKIVASVDAVELLDRRALAPGAVAKEVTGRLEAYPVPAFIAAFIRDRFGEALEAAYVDSGPDGKAWKDALATIDDLIWSVQPKRTREDRRHLAALLPGMLKRINDSMGGNAWSADDQRLFMEHLFEAHNAALKPAASSEELPTSAVAEQARIEAERARAVGDEASAASAAERAAAMALAEAPTPAPPAAMEPEPAADDHLDIARNLARGDWVEFSSDEGEMTLKLAWISPLRGTYLFANRQGQRTLSISAAELAEHFRTDRARLIETQPLFDRAMTSVLDNLSGRAAQRPGS